MKQLLLIFVWTLFQNSFQQTSLDEVLAAREEDVKRIAQKAEKLYSERCSTYKGCPKCTYHACASTLPELKCNKDFDILNCKGCSQPGVNMDLFQTMVRTPLSTTYLTDNQRSIVCAMAPHGTDSLDSTFSANHLEHIGELAWQYVGFEDGGLIKTYPGSIPQCSYDYDPRFRQWYVGASSGAKNVIILLDTSGSMISNDRIGIAKAAAKLVISTLTNADWFGFVNFGSFANKYSDQLIRASTYEKDRIIQYIENLETDGMTNFEDPLKQAYKLLQQSHTDKYGTACHNIILFMTDGEVNQGEQNKDKLLEMIGEMDSGLDVTMFTYSVGEQVSDEILKSFACSKKGIWTKISDSDLHKLRTAMGSYYNFLARGIISTHVSWTEPYEDAFGMGKMTTASLPVYDNTVNPPLIVGVAGVDILMSSIYKFEGDNEVILQRLISRSSKCTQNILNDCQLEELRDSQAKCNNVNKNETNCPNFSPIPCISVSQSQAVCGGQLAGGTLQKPCCGTISESNKCYVENGNNALNIIILPIIILQLLILLIE